MTRKSETVSQPATVGRPRGKVRETRTIYLRLPNALVERIHEHAKARGWTITRYAEMMLADALSAAARTSRSGSDSSSSLDRG